MLPPNFFVVLTGFAFVFTRFVILSNFKNIFPYLTVKVLCNLLKVNFQPYFPLLPSLRSSNYLRIVSFPGLFHTPVLLHSVMPPP